MNVLAGADFFPLVLSWRGLVTYYVLFFIQRESRRVRVAGITRHPDQERVTLRAICSIHESFDFTGMFNGEGVVLSATNAFESQNTVGIDDNHQNEDRKIRRGARQRKIPTLRNVPRRVGKVN